MQKDSKILLIVGLIVAVGIIGLVVYGVKGNTGPGPLDGFATALKDSGAVFYGAFWCPHCQAEKKLFGNSERLLPYVECSALDGNSQNQTCNDQKIEGYPTWFFKNGITIDSDNDPTVCPVKIGDVVELGACQNVASQYDKVWIFSGHDFSIKSPTDPTKIATTTWQFATGAETVGEIPLDFLAQQIKFTLPK